MRFRTKTALGIDIGSRRIRAVLVEKTARGIRILAAASSDLPADGPRRAGVRARMLSRVFRKLGRRAAVREVKAAVAVSSNSTIMRLLDLPRQMPTNVREFVETELNQYVALSGRRRRMDFCGVPTGSAGQKRLLVVAADADEMEEILHACGAARIAVHCVEPAALAYVRACLGGEKGLWYSGGTLIAMLGASRLVMCLFCRGILDFVRIRDLPPDMESPDQVRVWLAEELNGVLQYCRTLGSPAMPEMQIRVVIHDARYDKSDLVPLCVADAKTPVVVDSCETIGFPGETEETPSVVALGAALRLLAAEEEGLRIDLTPHEVVHARSSSRRLLIAANVAALLFLAIFLGVQVLAKTTDAMSRRIGQARLEGQLYTMSAVAAQDRYLDEEIARIRSELADANVVRARGDVDWPAVLGVIARSTPPGVNVAGLACGDGRRLIVKGGADSYDGVKLLAQNLDGRDAFESVRPVHMERRRIDADVVEYEIECRLKTMTEEPFRGDRSQS